MTPAKQRIAIAKECGWFNLRDNPSGPLKKAYINFDKTVPDYLNDLNAMHEAEKTLDRNEPIPPDLMCEYDIYWYHLRKINADIVGATAAQRAEAFLRTKGLWEE